MKCQGPSTLRWTTRKAPGFPGAFWLAWRVVICYNSKNPIVYGAPMATKMDKPGVPVEFYCKLFKHHVLRIMSRKTTDPLRLLATR